MFFPAKKKGSHDENPFRIYRLLLLKYSLKNPGVFIRNLRFDLHLNLRPAHYWE